MGDFFAQAATLLATIGVLAVEHLVLLGSCFHDGGKRAERTLLEALDISLFKFSQLDSLQPFGKGVDLQGLLEHG